MNKPKGKLVDRKLTPDTWYGNNVTEIIETPDGKYFRVCYHESDPSSRTVKEVFPHTKTEWKERP